MRCNLDQSKKLALRTFAGKGVLAVIFLLAFVTTGTTSFASDFTNRIVSIHEKGASAVQIVAEKEIGSRYTSYLLSKPPRVVFDFQGTDISSLPGVTTLSASPVREIIVSQYESAGVKSGRIELILTERVPYNVKVDGTILHVNFTPATPAAVSLPTPALQVADSVVVTPAPAPAPAPAPEEVKPEVAPVVVSADKKNLSAVSILEIVSRKGEVYLRADGELNQCKSFALKSPARFVVDCFGVTEKIEKNAISLSGPIKSVRVGTYTDKVRFVLEGDVKIIDKLKMYPVVDGLALRYDDKTPSPVTVAKSSSAPKAEKEKNAALTVEKVDFKVVDGHSLVIVTLSAPGEVMQPIKDKTLLRFGVKGATITPSLRRTIDASAFPSVIRQITPYTVSNRAQSDVRFAVELKGDTSYELKSDGNVVTLMVENGSFTKAQGPLDTTIELPLDSAVTKQQEKVAVATSVTKSTAKVSPEVITNDTLKITEEKRYSGQIVSLNFDNIEIRNVLLLIAEVSDTNIIANDDVKGVITLRLNNVPWDQALDVILESKGLAMEREGNILRIAPKEVVLKRKLDKATIESEIRKLELTSNAIKKTKTFSLNFAPVEQVANQIIEYLKGQGVVSFSTSSSSGDGNARVNQGERSASASGRGTSSTSSFKSDYGVSIDARTRKIIVSATPEQLIEIEEQIIKTIDIEVPGNQITIEARIVEANSNFTRDLGVSWGVSQQGTAQGPWDLSGGMIAGGGAFTINPGTQATNTTGPVFNRSAGIGSQFTFGRIGIDSTILDLRLSALEASGYGKIVSTPRVTTTDKEPAEISQGTQIPYQTTSEDGPVTEFIDATLSLKVKPTINPDQTLTLEIEVSNDSVGSTVATGVGSAPSINKKMAKTKVLVKNGETTVIGGIFIETDTESEVGIPLLRNIPILGHLFKSTKKSKDKTELMIFITPTVVQ